MQALDFKNLKSTDTDRWSKPLKTKGFAAPRRASTRVHGNAKNVVKTNIFHATRDVAKHCVFLVENRQSHTTTRAQKHLKHNKNDRRGSMQKPCEFIGIQWEVIGKHCELMKFKGNQRNSMKRRSTSTRINKQQPKSNQNKWKSMKTNAN